MALAAEMDGRIKIWMEELKKQIFIKLGDVRFEGWLTKERISYEEASKQEYKIMEPGTPWGGKWEYGWFRSEIILPQEAEGHRIYLRPDVGGEMLVWVNGHAAGSRDLQHDGITLTTCGKKGERFSLAAESYAGHGPRLENGGPCPPEQVAVPEPPQFQVKVGNPDFGIWNEEAFQLLMDVFTLYKLSQGLDKKSLRAMKLKEGLFQFTRIVDFELEPEERNETFKQARESLKPLLSCVNGSTTPELTVFGQSHLDLAWLWPWEETKRKCARTISTQIALSDEYEDYKFLLCEPPIMEELKKNYKELYERLLKKVKEGKFIPEGGMYIEPDTSLVSGESLIRQCLYGRKWFQEELGTDSVMVWLPDCFGFNGQLPQIMRGCGIRYFATQKIARALKGCDVFPYNIFWWEGIDGTRILTHFYKKNNARLDPLDVMTRWEEDRVQQENIETFIYPFGFGDGGGGATREMAEVALRIRDLEGMPKTRMESPVEFFKRLEEKGEIRESYKGELYLPWHRGTLTSQARIKRANRKMEQAIREGEMWNSLGTFINHVDNQKDNLETLWKFLLFNQFHDILPGTSITRVYEDALKDMEILKEKTGELIKEGRKKLTVKDKDGLIFFNSLSWEREELAELPVELEEYFKEKCAGVTVQISDGHFLVPVKVPSCGYTDVSSCRELSLSYLSVPEKRRCRAYQEGDSWILENQYIKAVINHLGQITSFIEKESKTEFVSGLCNEFHMYKDVNIEYDAWEIGSVYETLPVSLSQEATVEIVQTGPYMAAVKVERILHHSSLVQEIQLSFHSRRLDFVTQIDWKETHKLLKTSFSVDVMTDDAYEEIQFGYVKRPTHKNRRHDADRFEVCNHRYTALSEPGRTAAVLNDCKYGISTAKNCMELTLLKAPVWPDMHADKGNHQFTYSLYARSRDFSESGVIQEGMQLNNPISCERGGRGEREFFCISCDHAILETVKMAEDGEGDLILRLYEAAGKHGSCRLELGFAAQKAWKTTMEERLEEGTEISLEKEEGKTVLELSFSPFEIKTIRLRS